MWMKCIYMEDVCGSLSVCVYMYVYIYICMYVCMYIFIYIYIFFMCNFYFLCYFSLFYINFLIYFILIKDRNIYAFFASTYTFSVFLFCVLYRIILYCIWFDWLNKIKYTIHTSLSSCSSSLNPPFFLFSFPSLFLPEPRWALSCVSSPFPGCFSELFLRRAKPADRHPNQLLPVVIHRKGRLTECFSALVFRCCYFAGKFNLFFFASRLFLFFFWCFICSFLPQVFSLPVIEVRLRVHLTLFAYHCLRHVAYWWPIPKLLASGGLRGNLSWWCVICCTGGLSEIDTEAKA